MAPVMKERILFASGAFTESGGSVLQIVGRYVSEAFEFLIRTVEFFRLLSQLFGGSG
jgi:hypothetical protein